MSSTTTIHLSPPAGARVLVGRRSAMMVIARLVNPAATIAVVDSNGGCAVARYNTERI